MDGKQLESAIIDDDLTPFTNPVGDDEFSGTYGSVERDLLVGGVKVSDFRDGGEKHNVLKEFFGHDEGTIINPTNSGEFPDGDKLMTDGDTGISDPVEDPAVGCG